MSNDVLNYINTNFGSVIVLIVVIVISLIAVLRFGVNFDLNTYMESRKNRHKALAQKACPHMIVGNFSDDGRHGTIKSYFASPPGTTAWICEKCGAIRYNNLTEDEMKVIATYYLENPDKYKKVNKEYTKHAIKSH